MELARGELPREPAVDRAEEQIAFFRARLEARDVGEQPLELGRGEIRIDHEARLRADRFGEARLFQRLAALGGAPVLPDDGAVRGLSGAPVPHDHRFSLVGDADRGKARGGELRFPERGARAGELRAENLLGVVLDPAGPGKELAEFLLRRGARAPALVEYDRARAGRALVERKNVLHSGRGAGRSDRAILAPPRSPAWSGPAKLCGKFAGRRKPSSTQSACSLDAISRRRFRRCAMRMRHPSPAASAIRNDPAPTTTAPMARATRSPAGARRSTVIAAATTAIARRSMTPMTRRIAMRPTQQWLQWRPRRRPCRQAVPASAGSARPRPGASRQQAR